MRLEPDGIYASLHRINKSCGGQLQTAAAVFLRRKPTTLPSSRSKATTHVPVGLLTCVSNDGLSAFSDFSNDWLSPTTGRLDTYSAGSVGTYTPFSCSARQSSCDMSGHGNNYLIQISHRLISKRTRHGARYPIPLLGFLPDCDAFTHTKPLLAFLISII